MSGVRSCNFALDRPIDAAAVSGGSVTMDGQALQHGTEWTVSEDGQTLEIVGPACDAVMAGGNHVIDASFPCGGGGGGPIG
jgi:hypothetical protein